MKITTKFDIGQPVSVPDKFFPENKTDTRIIGITYEVSLKKTDKEEVPVERVKYQVEAFPFDTYGEGVIEALPKKKEAAQGEQ